MSHCRPALLFAWLLGLALPAVGAAPAVPVERIDAWVRQEMVRQKVPGVAVAVVQAGKPVLARGFGLANVELDVPVGPKTVFQSGSLGKQFTAAVVMLEVEQGRLTLDTPLTRIFPDAPAAWVGITPRHLLTHTSGIPDYTDGLIDLRRDYSEDELLRSAYAALHDLVLGAWYGNPDNWPGIGYPGPAEILR